jgi:hypothetical protein
LDAIGQVPADASELAAVLQARTEESSRERKAAIACFLSGGDGWREALALLGGAFAPDGQDQQAEDALKR